MKHPIPDDKMKHPKSNDKMKRKNKVENPLPSQKDVQEGTNVIKEEMKPKIEKGKKTNPKGESSASATTPPPPRVRRNVMPPSPIIVRRSERISKKNSFQMNKHAR